MFTSAAADWGSIHTLVVHFPIALLCVVPLFLVSALFFQRSQKVLYAAALGLMLLGTAGILLAVSTGNSAAEPLGAENPAMVSALTAHVSLGEQARLNFSILTVVFLLYVAFQSKLAQKFSRKANLIAVILYLAVYLGSLVILFNAAHYGGELVHKHGISSTLYSSQN